MSAELSGTSRDGARLAFLAGAPLGSDSKALTGKLSLELSSQL